MKTQNHHTALYSILLLLLVGTQPIHAQVLERYHEIYPTWPFSAAQAATPGYSKCSVWKTVYVKTEGDVSGEPWTQDTIPAHRYQRYDFYSGKPRMLVTYTPDNEKIQTMEYFYRNDLLAAIEVLQYDTLQRSRLEYVTKYSYRYSKGQGPPPTGEAFLREGPQAEASYANQAIPAQRIREYGPPFQAVRLLNEFDFDTLYHLRRLKTTVVGQGPQMETRLGWVPNEKRLLTIEYTDTSMDYKVMRDMHLILEDRFAFLDENGRSQVTHVRNARGEHLWTIDHEYDELGRPQKLIHWVRSVPQQNTPPPLPRKGGKKKKPQRQKNKKNAPVETPKPVLALAPAEPVVYKIEYFTYDADGLLEQHITEERGRQIVLQYSYFNE